MVSDRHVEQICDKSMNHYAFASFLPLSTKLGT